MWRIVLWISIFPSFLCVLGCTNGGADQNRIVGLWGMGNITSNGQIASDGNEWFEFKADGTVEARSSPFTYQSGTWRMDEKDHFLWLKESNTDSLRYDYKLTQDTLRLSATVLGMHQIGICLVPISKKPIQASEEMHGQ